MPVCVYMCMCVRVHVCVCGQADGGQKTTLGVSSLLLPVHPSRAQTQVTGLVWQAPLPAESLSTFKRKGV